MSIRIEDRARVRTLTLDRPEALNAFDTALYDATTEAVRDAAADPSVAVVLLTGAGRAFSAGTDLREMRALTTDPNPPRAAHGFTGMIDAFADLPKPLICAVNGIGLGAGVTLLGFSDLTFMSSEARLKCPFTDLGVAPEAGSSFLLPRLIGHQNAAWMLMSSEWIDAQQAKEMGLAWKVCPPDELLDTAREHAELLAAKPVSSLTAVKETMTAPLRAAIADARTRENACFADLLGGPANTEALTAFAEGRAPDFGNLPAGA
ncbi:enoyl-CoA hydratase/isomerase family protein [Prescottella sp. R16]|uniref:enoyl-CoA hydratase/isomerase family protein n=1 Tax=Prescottella sp. R16 TaxID=3064529 RepID=UPI00272EDD06|nr:enoyl-CoA hydratase/isomerase family protein [Prescottella sp. R16]